MDRLQLNMLRTLIEEAGDSSSAHLEAVLNVVTALSEVDITIEEVFSAIAYSYATTYDW